MKTKRFYKKPGWKLMKLAAFCFFVFLSILLIFSLGLVLINSNNFRFTGFAIEQNLSDEEINDLETVLENYNVSSINLDIKEPVGSGLLGMGEAVTRNKNSRMNFNLKEGSVRLYFDLLNYSYFVEGIVSEDNNPVSVMQDKESEQNIQTNATKEQDNSANESLSNVSQAGNESLEGIYNETVSNEIENITDNSSENVNNFNENNNGNETIEKEANQEQENEAIEKVIQDVQNPEQENEITNAPITGFFIRFFGLMGRVIGIDAGSDDIINETNISSVIQVELSENKSGEINQTNSQIYPTSENSVSVDINDIKETLSNLTNERIEEISDLSVIPAESFEISVNTSKINDEKSEVKWGYKIKLNHLKFMAKIDVTSEQSLSKYNEYSLKIGNRNVLSFEDLVQAGYRVRIETPALEIPVKIPINLTKIKTTENITVVNKTEKILNITTIDETIVNQTEINITIPVVNESETLVNEIEEEIIINDTENIESGDGGGSAGEENKEEKAEQKDEKQEEKETKEENKEEKTEKTEVKEENKEKQKEDKTEPVIEIPSETTESPASAEQPVSAPAEVPAEIPSAPAETTTGGVIKLFKLTGRIIAITGKVIANSVNEATEGLAGTGKA